MQIQKAANVICLLAFESTFSVLENTGTVMFSLFIIINLYFPFGTGIGTFPELIGGLSVGHRA